MCVCVCVCVCVGGGLVFLHATIARLRVDFVVGLLVGDGCGGVGGGGGGGVGGGGEEGWGGGGGGGGGGKCRLPVYRATTSRLPVVSPSPCARAGGGVCVLDILHAFFLASVLTSATRNVLVCAVCVCVCEEG